MLIGKFEGGLTGTQVVRIDHGSFISFKRSSQSYGRDKSHMQQGSKVSHGRLKWELKIWRIELSQLTDELDTERHDKGQNVGHRILPHIYGTLTNLITM